MPISYNEPITFGRSGTARALNCSGIDFLEDGLHSWTNLPTAEMEIQLPLARQDVTFQIDATPFTVPEVIASQQVFIFMGGLFIGFYHFANRETRNFPVSRNTLSGRPVRMSLVIPTARSPKSLNVSDDLRELGISLHTIAFMT